MYTYKLYPNYQQAAAEWHTHISKDSPLHLDELGIQQQAQLSNLQYYYAITYLAGKPILLSYFQLLHVTPEHFNCQDKVFQQYSLNAALCIVKPTLLVVGNLFRHDCFFFQFTTDEFTDEEKAYIFKQTFEYVLNESKASGIFIKDIPAFCAEKISPDTSYHRMEDDVSMVLKIPATWESMMDYEKALKHKYAQRYRKISKQVDGIEIKQFGLEDVERHQHDIESLYLQVSDNQLVSMGKINHQFFVDMKKKLGDRFKVFGWFYEERLIAFSSAILHDGVYDMNYIGFCYALNQSHSIYFNILFHCLEQAILTGSTKLVLGRTALEAKAILGCEPEYQYSFYKLRNVVVNWFFKKVSAGFKEQIGEKWKDRHPFKSSFYEKEN